MVIQLCKRCKQKTNDWYRETDWCCRPCWQKYVRERYVPKPKQPYVQPEHLKATLEPTEQDWAWFAGFYEGEGSVNASGLQIAQKQAWPLEWCRERFGGRICRYARKRDGSLYYKWWLTGPVCRAVLRRIRPLLSPRRQGQMSRILERA